MPRPHYIAGNGEFGCIYDNCAVFTRKRDAIDYLAELFSDTRGVKRQLRSRGYCELDGLGAYYCEVVACTCSDPSIHEEA